MTPERANVLALTECLMDVPDEPTVNTMVRAILAACAEERRAALTEAAELCNQLANEWQPSAESEGSRDDYCARCCASAVLALRDGEQK